MVYFMFFEDYKNFPEAKINPTLLWEYDYANIDYKTMREVIVQRVIERGWPEDWYAMLNLYGVSGVKSAIKNLSYLNDIDRNFVSHQFNIPLTSMKCFTATRSVPLHWNS
jgi:hypothetical protein